MDKDRIFEVVEELIGPVYPFGETREDESRLENLKKMTFLIDKLMFKVSRAATSKDRIEYSMKKIGEVASEFLKDIRDSIDE